MTSAGKETDGSDTPAQIIDLVANFRLRRQWEDVKDLKIKKSFYLDHLKSMNNLDRPRCERTLMAAPDLQNI